MRRFSLVLASVVAVAPSAGADTLRATRRMPMFEASHTVDVRIADGVAIYKVQRMFSNPGTVADQVELELDLPYGATATGLRIRANDTWYDGVLMERDRAEALYRELTGYGSAVAKDPALLAWLWADKLMLQVFPVMPRTVSTVEYTLTVPTRYENGRYVVSYPRTDTGDDSGDDVDALPLAAPVVTVRPAWGDARTEVVIDGRRVARNTPVVLVPPVVKDLFPEDPLDPGAGYAASTIEIAESEASKRTFTTVALAVELVHTYKSDLEVDLVTPEGARLPVHRREGGGDNDLKGTFTIALPPNTRAAGAWRLVVSDHVARDAGSLDRWSLAFGTGKGAVAADATDTPVFVPDAPENESDAGVAAISVAPPPIATWQGRLGRAVASAKHAFSRVEIDVAPQLVPMPKKAQVVFVVDASHSVGEDALAAQLATIRAYVAHVPDAEVEIVAYRRRAQRVFGRFVHADGFGDALAVAKARGAFALGNGSALDDGARLAASLLAERKGPRRMLVMTDERMRGALTVAMAHAAFAKLPADAVVHLVVPRQESDVPILARRDDAELATLATKRHGISVGLDVPVGVAHKALVPVVLELVRPTRIEKLSIPGFELDQDVLREGDGLRLVQKTPDAPRSVTVSGYLWSDRIEKRLVATEPFSRQTAAFVFGADEHQGLSEAEQYTLAMYGRAVSPVTSYVAWEPGTRPSTIGLYGGLLGGFGYGTIGHGAGGGGIGVVRTPPNLAALFDVAACEARVKPAGTWRVDLALETTLHEIVDVTTPSSSAMATCLVEQAWTLALDRATFDLERETYEVTLAGGGA